MSSTEQVVFRHYPLGPWLFGMVTLTATGIAVRGWELLLFVPIGVALIGFACILTVTVDRARGTLNLHYRSPFRASTKTYPVSEICFVNVVEDSEGEGMYRLELGLWSGQVVPLRSWYSGGKASNERRAQRLRSALP